MFACTRLARRVCCPRPPWRTAQHLALIRNNSSLAPDPPADESSLSPNHEVAEEDDNDEFEDDENRNNEPLRDVSYSEFKESIGERYQHASTKNWLGGEVVEFVFAWSSCSS
jgi:hypothetical protein